MMIRGIGASAGIAIRPAFILDQEDYPIRRAKVAETGLAKEVQKFKRAVDQTRLLPPGATLVPHLFVLGGHLTASLLIGSLAAAFFALQNPADHDPRARWWVALATALAFAVYPFGAGPFSAGTLGPSPGEHGGFPGGYCSQKPGRRRML